MILLCTGLSLPVHFVKSLHFVCALPSVPGQLVSRAAGHPSQGLIQPSPLLSIHPSNLSLPLLLCSSFSLSTLHPLGLISSAWQLLVQHPHWMGPPGVSPLCPHTQFLKYCVTAGGITPWHNHTTPRPPSPLIPKHTHLLWAWVKLWRVAGGVIHGGGRVGVHRG